MLLNIFKKYIILNLIKHLGEKYGYGALMDISDFNRYAVKFCTGGEYSCKFCIALIQFVAGYDYEQLAEVMYRVISIKKK